MPPLKLKAPSPKASFRLCSTCDGHGFTLIDRIISDHIKTQLKISCEDCHGTGKVKNYRPREIIKRKESVILHKYTKLSRKQLDRLEQMGGNGAHAKYTADGQLSLELARRVQLAKRKQPKFVLYSMEHGREIFVADRDLVKIDREKTPLTTNVKEALTFIEGFDSEEKKINYFNELTKLKLQSKRL